MKRTLPDEMCHISDPAIFQINRLAPHSDHDFYSSEEEFLSKQSQFIYSLNGQWPFDYAPTPWDCPLDFYQEDISCHDWSTIPVPAHIQLKSYGRPQYTNVQYPWDGLVDVAIGETPVENNEIGSYVKYFDLPEFFQEKRVFISFQGVESAIDIWLNGHYIGYSEDSFTPAEFELTPFIFDRENKLAVRVYRWCSASWLEDQDFFRFSGIFRAVYLYAIPKLHLQNLAISPEIKAPYDNAVLTVTLDLWGLDAKSTHSPLLRAELWYDAEMIHREENLLTETEKTLTFTITNPKLWSAEKPHLYQLKLWLSTDGKLMEYIQENVGFRSFVLEDGLMKINGQRLVFKGVNRHEFHPVTGRVLTVEDMERDIRLLKQHNINAVRTSHYPNATNFYRLCDHYGIYLIDETNLETHGTWEKTGASKGELYQQVLPGDDRLWLPALLDRANNMVQRDKNHPCILLWSLGNESYGGQNLYEMSQYIRQLDPSRPIHYEGLFHDNRYPESSDIHSQMYPSVDSIVAFLTEHPDGKPFICCEYAHAMGNSCGAMDKYTTLAYENIRYQGGFIWDYIDQTLLTKNIYGENYLAYGGDFGDRPHDGNFCGNGIVYSDRTPSPKMAEVKYLYQGIEVDFPSEDSIQVINRNLFTSTTDYLAKLQLHKEGVFCQELPMEICLAPGEIQTYPNPLTLPKQEGEYTFTLSFHLKEDTLWQQSGYPVATGQGVFSVGKGYPTLFQDLDFFARKKEPRKSALLSNNDLHLVVGKHNLGVRGRDFHVLFSKLTGEITSYVYDGKEFLLQPIRPNFWRAPVDNDRGNAMMQRYSQWKIASLYSAKRGELTWEETTDGILVHLPYLLPTLPAAHCSLSYLIRSDGAITVTLSYPVVVELGDMPEFGVIISLPIEYDTVSWYGKGPTENTWDRNKGSLLGRYENSIQDNLSQYLRPQECGGKTEVRYAHLTNPSGRGLVFYGESPFGFTALPYTPHELENALHPYELPRPTKTILRIYAQQMGVGGDDSWGAKVHPEYLLDVAMKEKVFRFTFQGI